MCGGRSLAKTRRLFWRCNRAICDKNMAGPSARMSRNAQVRLKYQNRTGRNRLEPLSQGPGAQGEINVPLSSFRVDCRRYREFRIIAHRARDGHDCQPSFTFSDPRSPSRRRPLLLGSYVPGEVEFPSLPLLAVFLARRRERNLKVPKGAASSLASTA